MHMLSLLCALQGSSTSSTHATHTGSGASAENLAGRSQVEPSRGLGSPVLQQGMRTSLNTAMGLQLPSARFVASPPVFQPDSASSSPQAAAHCLKRPCCSSTHCSSVRHRAA